MTSRFSADIAVDAGPRNKAVYDAVTADGRYYDGPDDVDVQLDDMVRIRVSSDRVAHLRAAVNSALRLARTADDSIRSVGYNGAGAGAG